MLDSARKHLVMTKTVRNILRKLVKMVMLEHRREGLLKVVGAGLAWVVNELCDSTGWSEAACKVMVSGGPRAKHGRPKRNFLGISDIWLEDMIHLQRRLRWIMYEKLRLGQFLLHLKYWWFCVSAENYTNVSHHLISTVYIFYQFVTSYKWTGLCYFFVFISLSYFSYFSICFQ